MTRKENFRKLNLEAVNLMDCNESKTRVSHHANITVTVNVGYAAGQIQVPLQLFDQAT